MINFIEAGFPIASNGDFEAVKEISKNIIKAYIIGKNISFFEKQIKNKISYIVSKNLEKAISHIYQDIKFSKIKHKTILLSPAAASYDQFKNFEERGNRFKQLIKK